MELRQVRALHGAEVQLQLFNCDYQIAIETIKSEYLNMDGNDRCGAHERGV